MTRKRGAQIPEHVLGVKEFWINVFWSKELPAHDKDLGRHISVNVPKWPDRMNT